MQDRLAESDKPPATSEEWRRFLHRYSEELLATDNLDVSDAARRSDWMGFAPAGEAAIVRAEQGLGRKLPPSLRTFYSVSNGWRTTGFFVYNVLPVEEIGWLRDREPVLHSIASDAESTVGPWKNDPGDARLKEYRDEQGTEGLPTRSCPESPPEVESDFDWSVTFRDRHPISAVFRGDQATLEIHLESFSNEGEEFNYPLDIKAVYSIVDAPDGPKLVREGRVQVTWATARRPRFGQRAVLESKFRVRFERMFCEEFFVQDITLPNAPEGFGVLRDFVIKSDNGWFTTGFRRIPGNDSVQRP